MAINPVGSWGQTSWALSTASTAAFDYKTQIDQNMIVMQRQGTAFAPTQHSPPNMTVSIGAGYVFKVSTATLTEVGAQVSATIAAPVGSPRIDRIVADQYTGVISVVTGTPATIPIAPTIPANSIPICRITLQTTTTQIGDSMIVDERVIAHRTLAGNYQEFTSTGAFTWGPPQGFSSQSLVMFALWGPGGAGLASTIGGSGGGGGGACIVGMYRLGDLSTAVTVTIAPGTPISTANSTSPASASVFNGSSAYGGSNGLSIIGAANGGAGGGVLGGGQVAAVLAGGAPLGGTAGGASVFGGGGGGNPGGGASVYGGGGGANGAGGASLYGGGGGAANAGAGGVSIYGGNGGSSGVAGTAPGGGGGVNAAGARGECRVWIWR